MNELIQLLNKNAGVIQVLGLFFVIPLSIVTDKIIRRSRQKKYKREMKEILLKELWMNTNFVSQLEDSYENNLLDDGNLHIPHYSPRVEILEKYFQYELLSSLSKYEKNGFIEIYSQLSNLKVEYIDWRNLLKANSEIINEPAIYTALSSTMLSYIDPLMRNLLGVWINIVKDIGARSDIKQLQDLNKVVIGYIRQGKWIRTSYKSSYFNKPEYTNIEKFDVILCWKNDWDETEKEVVEVKNILALYDSWKK